MVTNRVRRKGGKDSAEITDIISVESGPLQSLLLSLDLSSCCSNLSRAPIPKHASKSARLRSEGILFRLPRESVTVSIFFIYRILQILLLITELPL
jgi:hypothetical protein